MPGSPKKRARREAAIAGACAGARSDYAESVAEFRASNPDPWTTEDILIACRMEIELLGTARDASAQRISWMKVALDARKQSFAEQQATGAVDKPEYHITGIPPVPAIADVSG